MNRRSLISGLLLGAVLPGLAACGFRPIYSEGAGGRDVSGDLAAIAIEEPKTRLAQLIRNDLLASMRPAGRAAEDRYRLTLTPKLQETTSVETNAEGALRQRVRLSVQFELVELATGAPLVTAKTSSQASYDETGQSFSDARAQTNALERVAKETSTDIRSRLAAYFASR